MIDHMGLPVSDIDEAAEFYEAVLAPLGYGLEVEIEEEGEVAFAAFGLPGEPAFFIVASGQPVNARLHVAFKADDRAAVRAFHMAALAAGGTDNGAPGLRPHYHDNYYAAYVIDPDGHNIEAVCHLPEAN